VWRRLEAEPWDLGDILDVARRVVAMDSAVSTLEIAIICILEDRCCRVRCSSPPRSGVDLTSEFVLVIEYPPPWQGLDVGRCGYAAAAGLTFRSPIGFMITVRRRSCSFPSGGATARLRATQAAVVVVVEAEEMRGDFMGDTCAGWVKTSST
jgi:hypothetical protein